MILKDVYRYYSDELKAAGIATPELDARLLICYALRLTHENFILQAERDLELEESDAIEMVIARRQAHEPVSKIIGEKEFYGLPFLTSPQTLDPRPDSETLIDAVLETLADNKKPYRLLDLGTGTGCLLLTLLDKLENASGVGVDRSEDALRVARENARGLGLMMCADFIQSDWFQSVTGEFDIIVSNPPYIPTDEIQNLSPDVRDYDPHAALDGGADGLDPYRLILAGVMPFLKTGGLLAFEVGYTQAPDVAELMKKAGFAEVSFKKDLSGIDRVVFAQRL